MSGRALPAGAALNGDGSVGTGAAAEELGDSGSGGAWRLGGFLGEGSGKWTRRM